MAIVLALLSATIYGTADFLGGLAARRSAVTAVVVVSAAAGLVLVLPAMLVIPGRFDPASVGWGAAAGVAGSTGLALFYRALAGGAMSVVAPSTAVTAAVVPVIGGLLLGERPAVPALAGVAVALAAVMLVSAEGGRLPSPRQLAANRSFGQALAAGAAFGLFYVLLSRTSDGSGLWPVVAARLTSVLLMVSIALLGRRPLAPTRAALPLALLAGIADTAANVLFLVAVRQGMLVVTSVLTSLYPASTVLLAQLVLKERLAALQIVGLVAAAGAVTLIAFG